jgi:hypothetical protein
MAMARKTWGGNRTANSARMHQIVASVLRTCWQQGKHAFRELVNFTALRRSILLDIIPPPPSPWVDSPTTDQQNRRLSGELALPIGKS